MTKITTVIYLYPQNMYMKKGLIVNALKKNTIEL